MSYIICLLKAKRLFRATLSWFLRQGQPGIKASISSPQRDNMAPVIFGNVKEHRAFWLTFVWYLRYLSK